MASTLAAIGADLPVTMGKEVYLTLGNRLTRGTCVALMGTARCGPELQVTHSCMTMLMGCLASAWFRKMMSFTR